MDKDIVSQFAEKVRQRITNTTHESQPWVYITVDKAVNHFFLDRWLKVSADFLESHYFGLT